jgi:hypothetical protein
MARDPWLEARVTAGRLVALARAGELDAVTGSLNLLSFAGRHRLRLILDALIEASASMLIRKAGSMGAHGTFTADIRGHDESALDIDGIDPPVRATIRALLAAVNGCPQDAAEQVTLAVAGGQRATVQVITLAIRWTVNAMDCVGDDARPDWLDRKVG